jgi:putative peptide zinc metalloprotease protein
LRPSRIEVMPYRREQLLSPALGWQAGGAVAVRPDDPKGVQALDPFFELYAWFEPPADDVKTLDGMTGWLRIPLPSKPLAMQATRSMQQLLQKRFSL